MTEFTRVRPTLPKRGAVSRFNDNTMEYVIAGARLMSMLCFVGWVTCIVLAILFNSVPLVLTGLFLTVVGVGCARFGFKTNANEEWVHGKTG